MNNIAQNIKKHRELAGLTQEELADRLSVTRQAVSSWETGRNNPNIEILQRLSIVFDCEIDELIYDEKKSQYEKYQKKYILLGIVCGAICVLIIASFALFGAKLKFISYTKYIPYWAAFQLFVIPTGFFAFGVLLITLLSMFTSTQIKKGKRTICLCIAVFLIMSFLLLMAEWIMILLGIDSPQLVIRILGTSVFEEYGKVLFLMLLPTITGILLFLGINKD